MCTTCQSVNTLSMLSVTWRYKWLQLQLQKFLDPQKHALVDNIFICPSKRYENNANHHHRVIP
jgi:hypothetical protein